MSKSGLFLKTFGLGNNLGVDCIGFWEITLFSILKAFESKALVTLGFATKNATV
ncbi:hypothetical protein HMPREF3230_00597 [Gardnerella vaginalis]|uniref:Uncharacterized protein n=1 Tax=Gardnerella vaginalis TaxID=2702 RepID=A0A135Z849_GARVA|nr:hypothetical protein HMPREF3230_00597 [Gardnerella vaginalis]